MWWLLLLFLVAVLQVSECNGRKTSRCRCNQVEEMIVVNQHTCFRPVLGAEWKRPSSFFPDFTPEEILELSDYYGNRWIEWNDDADDYYFTNYWSYTGILIISHNTVILVDSALGEVAPSYDLDNALYDRLEEMGCVDSIDYVLHTHIHRDHTGWDTSLNTDDSTVIEPTFDFPTEYLIAYNDYYQFSDGSAGARVSWDSLMAPLEKSGQLVLRFNSYWLVMDSVKVVPCLGHSPGHQCVYIYDDSDDTNDGSDETIPFAILIGDVTHHPLQISNPEWQRSNEWDLGMAQQTRRDMIEYLFENQILFSAVHFEYPNIGRIVECDSCGGENGLVYYKLTDDELQDLYHK